MRSSQTNIGAARETGPGLGRESISISTTKRGQWGNVSRVLRPGLVKCLTARVRDPPLPGHHEGGLSRKYPEFMEIWCLRHDCITLCGQ